MRISGARVAAAMGVAAVIAACANAAVDERTRQVTQPIVGGSPDTTHEATVSLLLGNGGPTVGRCSGTIVRVDASGKGTVLTSAHCFESSPTTVKISIGPDFDSPVRRRRR